MAKHMAAAGWGARGTGGTNRKTGGKTRDELADRCCGLHDGACLTWDGALWGAACCPLDAERRCCQASLASIQMLPAAYTAICRGRGSHGLGRSNSLMLSRA